VGTFNLARTDGQACGEGTLVIQEIRVVGDVAKAGTNRSLGVRSVLRFQERRESFENLLPAIVFQPILLLLHPMRFVVSGDHLSGRRQVGS
jgi:hypothetical protein